MDRIKKYLSEIPIQKTLIFHEEISDKDVLLVLAQSGWFPVHEELLGKYVPHTSLQENLGEMLITEKNGKHLRDVKIKNAKCFIQYRALSETKKELSFFEGKGCLVHFNEYLLHSICLFLRRDEAEGEGIPILDV